MRKKLWKLALFAIPHAMILIICLILVFSGAASPFLNGFDVDSQGRLYVGEGKMLRIYQNGVQTDAIELESDSYRLAVDDNGNLIIAYPSVVYHMDKKGNVLEAKDDPLAKTFQALQYTDQITDETTQDEYKLVNKLGRTRIVKNDCEVVYKISLLSFAVKILLAVCGISLFGNGILFVRHMRKERE